MFTVLLALLCQAEEVSERNLRLQQTTGVKSVPDLTTDVNKQKAKTEGQLAVEVQKAASIKQELVDRFGSLDSLANSAKESYNVAEEEKSEQATVQEVADDQAAQVINAQEHMSETLAADTLTGRQMAGDMDATMDSAKKLLTSSQDLSVMQDESNFEGLYTNIDAKATHKNQVLEAFFHKNILKEESANEKLHNAEELYKKNTIAMAESAKHISSGIKNDYKKSKKAISKMDKGIKKLISSAQKKINKIQQGNKVIDYKTVNKAINKDDKTTTKAVKYLMKDSQKMFDRLLKDDDGMFEDVIDGGDKAKDEGISSANKLMKGDERNTEQTVASARKLGESALGVGYEANIASSKTIQAGSHFQAEVASELALQQSNLKSMSEKIKKETAERVPAGQAVIDALGANSRTLLNEAATKLAKNVAQGTDQLDLSAQSAIMASSGAESEMESAIETQKVAGAQLANLGLVTGQGLTVKNKAVNEEKKRVKSITSKARFAMQLGQSSLEQSLKLGQQAFGVVVDGKLGELQRTVNEEVPKLEEPIYKNLDGTLREVADTLAAAKITQDDQLSVLVGQIKDIEGKVRIFGGTPQAVIDVHDLDTKARAKLNSFQAQLRQLSVDRDDMELKLKHTSDTSVAESEDFILKRARDLQRMVLDSVAERTRLFNEQLARMTSLVKNTGASNQANNAEMDSYRSSTQGEMGGLEGALASLNELESSQAAEFNGEIGDIAGPKLVELRTISDESTNAAAEAIKNAQMAQNSAAEAATEAGEENLSSDISARSAATQEEVEQEGERMRSLFADSTTETKTLIGTLNGEMETERTKINTAYQHSQAVLADNERTSADTATDANRLSDTTRKQIISTEAGAESQGKIIKGEVDAALKSAAHNLGKAQGEVADKLWAEVQGMETDAGNIANDGAAGMQKAQALVDGEGKVVTAAGKAAREVIANVEGRYKHVEGELSNELEQGEAEEASTTKQTVEDVDDISNAVQGSAGRNDMMLSAAEGDTNDMQTENDAKQSEIVNGIEARAEALNTENTAAFAGVDASIAGAKDQEHENEKVIKRAEGALWKQTKTMDEARMEFEQSTEMKVGAFKSVLDAQQKALSNNVNYLDKYERYTHHQELETLGSAIGALKNEALKSDEMFDEMELKAFKLTEDVGSVMNSGEFSTLQKIMKTDSYLQKVASEDGAIVGYLSSHEETGRPWMDKVMTALDAAHQNIITTEKEDEAKAKLSDDKVLNREDATKHLLEQTITNAGAHAAGKEIEPLSKSSANVADGGINTMSIHGLKAMVDQSLADARQQTAIHTEALKATQLDLRGTSDSVASMGADVQKLLDYNAKVVANDKKRVEERAKSVSDSLFYGAGPSSLSELLEQNAKLTKKHEALEVHHEDLGREVRQTLREQNISL